MSETETGGPAFPPMHNPSTHHSGMTLRDWFAGQALTNPYTAHDGDADKVAEWAYQVADAMIFSKSNRIGTQAVRNLEAKLAKAVDALTQIERAYYQEATNPSPETVRRMAARMNGIARDTQNALAELTSSEAANGEAKGGKDE